MRVKGVISYVRVDALVCFVGERYPSDRTMGIYFGSCGRPTVYNYGIWISSCEERGYLQRASGV